MALSNDLISQFVKITNDDKKRDKETIAYGEVTKVESDDDGNIINVEVTLDGATQPTPLSRTTDVRLHDRVIVMIKNHMAVITGNITSPSARTEYVKVIETKVIEAADKVTEFGYLIADMVTTDMLAVEQGRIDELSADNVDIKEQLNANSAKIESIQADVADISNIEATYAKITQLEAAQAEIDALEVKQAAFETATAKNFEAVNAEIDKLQANQIDVESLEATFANIDFSNISKATMQWFYANSGLIENVVVGEGTITGNLVGVTISGDLIEGNTVKAEKLVIKGSDGLYYKLNTDGVTTEAEQTDQNSLNGSIIKANSITASKINVDDLVAFDATIGGFNIADNSLYSGAKSSVDNTTEGVYLDSAGQMAVGDSNKYFKYFTDTDGTKKLVISADNILLGSSNRNVEDEINNVSSDSENTQSRVTQTEALLEILSESISMLITDGNGASLMTQGENGWTFSTGEIQDLMNRMSEALDTLTTEVGDTSNVVDILQQSVNDLGVIAEYVKIGTYEDEPCIELGEGDSNFKLRITNTRMIFTEGSSILAYFNNQSLHIKKAVVEEELQQGGFVWKVRSNGNLGLVWKGGNS